MNAARPASELAADVRRYGPHQYAPYGDVFHNALDELVSRLETAEAQVAALTQERDEQEGYPGIAHDFLALERRAEAAEAALAEATKERDYWESSYKQEHRTRHAMEDTIADTRRALTGYHDLMPALADCANECGEATLYSDAHRANEVARRALAASGGGTGQEQQP